MSEQERSGPTPAQVEALAKAKMKRRGHSPESFFYELLWHEAVNEAQDDLDAIGAGEVPGVFVADGEQWSVVYPEGLRLRYDERDARVIAGEVRCRAERRRVGRWEPVGEEQDHG